MCSYMEMYSVIIEYIVSLFLPKSAAFLNVIYLIQPCLNVVLVDPIAQLHRCFCRKLLERAVHTLIQPQSDSIADKYKKDSG